jgi:Transcriptional Coactivator p15 (PC4)
MQLDVREYYADDQGEQRPGRRGAALALAEAERLLALSPGLSQELAAVAPAPVKARPRSDQAQASQPASKRSSTGGTGTGTGTGGSSSSAAAAPLVVQLGARKRAAVSTLTGTACVDLRETYEVCYSVLQCVMLS